MTMLQANSSFSQQFEYSPFGTNDFYNPFLVAQVKEISTPDELDTALSEEKIPISLDLGVSNRRIHPGAFGSFAFGNIDTGKDGKDIVCLCTGCSE
ncbi:MAG: hypothetical protein ACE5HS_21575 [bacterium]